MLAIIICLCSSPSLGSVPTDIAVPLLVTLSVIFMPTSLLSLEVVFIEPTCIPVPPLTITIVLSSEPSEPSDPSEPSEPSDPSYEPASELEPSSKPSS